MQNFVTAAGTNFQIDGRPTPLTGVNCYFLAYCTDESRRAALLQAKAMGANVVRCWGFLTLNELQQDKVAFQYHNQGELILNDGAAGLERLDALIKAADDLDIRLILPLVNYWDDFGGMPSWVRWLENSSDVTQFYRSPRIRQSYRNWLSAILTRQNRLTGNLYSAEPAVMAWELTNEARCPISGGRELLLDWIKEMATAAKSLDSNHLLALGDEGFFYKRGRGHLYDGTYGVDWAENLAVDGIDFGTYHFYPQNWGYGDDPGIASRWIGDHSEIGAKLNKPVLLEEYGLKLDTKDIRSDSERNDLYAEWRDLIAHSGTAGGLLWMLGHPAPDTLGYVDEYVMYGPDNYAGDSSGQGKVIPG